MGNYKIDVRGQRVHEALESIEKILDTAIINGNSKLFILHGKGTGALLSGIHEYLKEQELIKEFYFAKPEFGGSGVTIIEI